MSTPERHAPVFAPQVQPPTTRSQPVSDAYANSTEEQMPPFRMLNVLIAKESPGSQALIEDEDIEDYVRTAVVLRVAAAVVPFVPTRVSTAFSRGLLNASTMASTIPQNLVSTSSPRTPRLRSEFVAPPLVTSCPEPRPLAAAVLLVDVSGFTRLSEEARRRAGSDGAERFAVALSAFFARITQVTASFSGDVDCFAGDALLVLFEPLPQSGGRKLGPEQRLRSAADRALACARAVHQHLDGFQHEPGDPPLRIHSALAVGTSIYAS
jgi:class 3 adenylate cyclase